MGSEWGNVKIGELFDLIPGFAFKSPDFIDIGIPVIKIKNIKPIKLAKHGFSYVDPHFLESKSRYKPLINDLLISMSGNRYDGTPETWVGKVCFFQERGVFLVNQRVGLLRNKAEIEIYPQFYVYYLAHEEQQYFFISIATSSGGQANLSPQQILSVPVPLPPFPTQKAIAYILGTLDDKIELLRQMNETLEAMARALFKSWFIDFDPVRWKMEGQPTGLPPEIDMLFTDSFEDSELGEIPKGWSAGEVAECCSFISRGLPPIYAEEDGIIVLNQKCIRNHFIDFTKARRHDCIIKPEGEKRCQLFDVLVNSTGVGTLGRVAQVYFLENTTTVDSHISIVRPKNETMQYYLGDSLINREEEIEALAEGSTGQTELSRTRLGKLSLVIPSVRILEKYNLFVEPVHSVKAKNQAEIVSLMNARDSLLPKLISGELELSDNDISKILEKEK